MMDPMNTNPCRLCCRVKFDALPMRFPLTEPTEQLFTGDLQDFVGTTVETVGTMSGCKAICQRSRMHTYTMLKTVSSCCSWKRSSAALCQLLSLVTVTQGYLKRKDNMLWNVLDQYMTNNEVLIDFSDPHTANINCDMHKYLLHLRHLVHHVPQSHYINDRLQV